MKKLFTLALSFAALSAFAAPNTGCGLGSQVIEKQDTVLKQVFAVTLNGISGNQTFGITAGSLGCTKPNEFVSVEAQEFMAQNMDTVAQEIAKGEGEALETLAKLLNKSNDATFASKLQANFDKVYTSANIDAVSVLNNIATVI